MAASRLWRDPLRCNSRLARVAASMAMRLPGNSWRGGRISGAADRAVSWTYASSAPAAASSGPEKSPQPSRVATPKRDFSVASARAEEKSVAGRVVPLVAWPSGTSSSAGARRAISPFSSATLPARVWKAPVERSSQARPAASLVPASAASQLERLGSSRAVSVMVPGVTMRTMARATTDLLPRFLASAGSSTCSAMATRWPARIRRAR